MIVIRFIFLFLLQRFLTKHSRNTLSQRVRMRARDYHDAYVYLPYHRKTIFFFFEQYKNIPFALVFFFIYKADIVATQNER